MDTNVSITAHESENAYTLEATPRGFKRIDPFVVKWEYPLMVRDDCLNPGKLKSAISKKQVYTANDLLTTLVAENMTTAALRDAVMEKTGMSQSKFYELSAELKELPGVSYDEKKRLWRYETPPKATLK